MDLFPLGDPYRQLNPSLKSIVCPILSLLLLNLFNEWKRLLRTTTELLRRSPYGSKRFALDRKEEKLRWQNVRTFWRKWSDYILGLGFERSRSLYFYNFILSHYFVSKGGWASGFQKHPKRNPLPLQNDKRLLKWIKYQHVVDRPVGSVYKIVRRFIIHRLVNFELLGSVYGSEK